MSTRYVRWLSLLSCALLPACRLAASSFPPEDWRLQSPGDTVAIRTPAGSLELKDPSPYDRQTPRAEFTLTGALPRGEIRWKTRNILGVPSFVIRLLPEAKGEAPWELAVRNQPTGGACVVVRRSGENGYKAIVESLRAYFRIGGDWLQWRLVFDTASGRAQLYLAGSAAPAAEVSGFDQPIGGLELGVGLIGNYYGTWNTGHGIEFADFSASSGDVTFRPVAPMSPGPVWPPERPAPADWVVKDKFAEFAAWWPGPDDAAGKAAREALRLALHHEALGLGDSFTDALRMVPVLANAIRWEEPSGGAQASHLSRSTPQKHSPWDDPSNARLMEPVALLARFYSLDQPWNPYFHDAPLGKRLRVALEYWLSLQTVEGGFPEAGGLASAELPAASFNLLAMAPIYDDLKDEPLFADLAPRWIEAMSRAVRWAAIPGSQPRQQGVNFANQYLGVISGAWNLRRITGDSYWEKLYNELADGWLAKAQPAGWFRESFGREDFGYSEVTDFLLDTMSVETQDPRWLRALDRAYACSQLVSTFEMDREAAVVDNVSHARTNIGAVGSIHAMGETNAQKLHTVGRANHLATLSRNALPYAFDAIDAQEAERRAKAFFAQMPGSLEKRAPGRFFKTGPSWGWPGPSDYWPVSPGARWEAVSETRPWRETRFTEIARVPGDDLEFAALRRPGYYITLHAGRVRDKRSTGVGALWVPGYGNVLLSANRSGRAALGWLATGDQLADAQKSLSLDWNGEKPEAAGHVTLLGEAQLPIDLSLGDESLTFKVAATPARPFYLPLIFRQGDRWTLADGVSILPSAKAMGNGRVTTQSLRLMRAGDGVTHDLEITFTHPVEVSFATSPSPLGEGLFVRGIALRPADAADEGPMTMALSRTAR